MIAELNRGLGALLKIRLVSYAWETDVRPGFHADGPQGLVDQILHIEDSDILIGIFWKRFGTPVKDADSGTEHEFLKAYESWKSTGRPEIMMYFCEKPYHPNNSGEAEQARRVAKFREEFPEHGLYRTYKRPSEFTDLVRNHLTGYLQGVR